MKYQLDVKGKSQFDKDIDERYQPSACGPVTAFVMMRYLFPNASPYNINDLYRLMGGTKIGLFKWRFIYTMRKVLGSNWTVAKCGIDEVQRQIKEGRPVAAKFDKWFSCRWRGRYEFDYHWVPVIGFEENGDDIALIVHDNGGRNRKSGIQYVSYEQNRQVLSFVKMEPVDGTHQ
ncbi:C39 family peptidase [Sporosarcina limicola]|uniref:Peptidase C39-like domain-containing protein n=1 Tax=Sporosarcina limicola TaxID=34101 RepID=A0A927MLB6_9BACL|nr:C39 family peptidase [Sporosarcina limicola]MBE1556465.1 hypothetical protein [Sporosarcina limicola]